MCDTRQDAWDLHHNTPTIHNGSISSGAAFDVRSDISVHNVSLWLRLLSAHYNLPSNLNGFRHVTPKLDPASDPPDQDVPIRLTQLAHPVQCYLMPTCNLRLIPLSLLLPQFYYFLCTLNVSTTGWVFNRGGFSSYLQFTAFISSPVDSNSQYCQPEFGSTGTYFLSPAETLHLRFRGNSGGPSTDVLSLRQYHPWHLLDTFKWVVELVFMSSAWTDWDFNTFTPISSWKKSIF